MTVTATTVPGNARYLQLPRYFPDIYIKVENTIYDFAGKLCSDYGGAFWEFATLSNGGFFMYPRDTTRDKWHIVSPNGYSGDVSAQAMGIIAGLFAYSALSFRHASIAEQYHLLRDYALDHAEQEAIFAAID